MLLRIFLNIRIQLGETLELPQQAAHHICTVLRLKTGDPLCLFNGDSINGQPGEFRGILTQEKKKAWVKILEFIPKQTESVLKIHLGHGLSRSERMDFVFQKTTELGVYTLCPILTEKSQFKLKSDRVEHKFAHWNNIIISASEQSGRTQCPTLESPCSLDTWIKRPFNGLSLVLDPDATETLEQISQTKAQPEAIRVLIGPESGLSPTEIKQAHQHGFKSLRLGPRILRTETASIAALTALQLKFGDLS